MSVIVDRFLKDIGVSMQYDDIGDMRHKLQLYDRCFDTKHLTEYDDFAYMIKTQYSGNAEAYLAEYTRVKEAAMDDIKSRPVFKQFNEAELKSIEHYPIADAQKTVYTATNDGRMFISIDMRKANFSSLKYYGVFTEGSWEEFLSKFTNIPHILNSKYIRQVILGNCSPKRQIQLEKSIMTNLLFEIQQYYTIAELFTNGSIAISAKSVDEIVISVKESSMIDVTIAEINKVISGFEALAGFQMFRVEAYKLHALTEKVCVCSDLTVSQYTNRPKVLGYIRQFYKDGRLTDKWDCKCLDNVRLFILIAQSLGNVPPRELFTVDTPYGKAILKEVTMPDFDWNSIRTNSSSTKTSVFS